MKRARAPPIKENHNINEFNFDRCKFYYWMQRELETELKQFYKKINSIKVLEDKFYIWFLDNGDCVSIHLNTMENVYNSGKSIKKLVALIDAEYMTRIKK